MEIDLREEFLAEYFVGPDLRGVVESVTNNGVMLTQSQVAKRTGALAASIRGHTEVGPVEFGEDRWIGEITMGGQGSAGTVDYGASYEFGAGDHEESEEQPAPRGKRLGRSARPGSTGRHHNRAAHVLDRVREELGGL